MELIKYKVCLLNKNKQYISKTPIIKIISIFKLIYANTAHIIFININNVTNFNNFINDYSRYRYIDIYIQKKDAFQNLINFQIKIKIQYNRGIHRLCMDNGKEYNI